MPVDVLVKTPEEQAAYDKAREASTRENRIAVEAEFAAVDERKALYEAEEAKRRKEKSEADHKVIVGIRRELEVAERYPSPPAEAEALEALRAWVAHDAAARGVEVALVAALDAGFAEQSVEHNAKRVRSTIAALTARRMLLERLGVK